MHQAATSSNSSLTDDDDESAGLLQIHNSSRSASNESTMSTTGVLRMLLLAATCAQTTLDVLLRSWSRHTLGETYSPASVLLVAETIKLVVSAWMSGCWQPARIWRLLQDSLPMALPGFMYLCMNLLQYEALARLDAATFGVTSQLKTLASAFFSFVLLGRRLSARRWRALLVLVAGVALIVQQSEHEHLIAHHHDVSSTAHEVSGKGASRWKQPSPFGIDFMIGIGAVLMQTSLSGFISVWVEKYLKANMKTLSVWQVC